MGGFSFLVSLRLRRVMMAWAGSTTLSVNCIPERGDACFCVCGSLEKRRANGGAIRPTGEMKNASLRENV